MRADKEFHVIQPNKRAALPVFRYYTPELQEAMSANRRNPAQVRRAAAKIERLRSAYLRQLKKIAGRISTATYRRFSSKKHPLFDSNLLTFAVGDALSPNTGRRFRTAVEARFLSFAEDCVHVLRYTGVTQVQVTVPKVRWYDWGDGIPEIGSLLAHELTSAGTRLMRHKLLFASGAYIDIVFAKVTWKTVPAKRR